MRISRVIEGYYQEPPTGRYLQSRNKRAPSKLVRTCHHLLHMPIHLSSTLKLPQLTYDGPSASFKPKIGSRNNLQRSLPADVQLKASNEEDDYDNSSDEEDNALDAGRNIRRPGPKPKLYFVYRKATDTLAAQLCRLKCDEMYPTPRDGGRQMFKMEMPRERSKSKGYQPQYQQAKANDRGFQRSQTPSPQEYPGRPSQDQASRPGHTYQPETNQRGSLRQSTERNRRSYSNQQPSPQFYPDQMIQAQANSRRYSHHWPECIPGGPRHQAQGNGQRYSHQLADTKSSSNTPHENNQSYSYYQVKESTPGYSRWSAVNTQDGSFYQGQGNGRRYSHQLADAKGSSNTPHENNQSYSYYQVKGSNPGYSGPSVNTQDVLFDQARADSRCRRLDTQGQPHHQAEDRLEKQINKMYVMPQSSPASQRRTREPARSSAIQ